MYLYPLNETSATVLVTSPTNLCYKCLGSLLHYSCHHLFALGYYWLSKTPENAGNILEFAIPFGNTRNLLEFNQNLISLLETCRRIDEHQVQGHLS